MPRVVYRQGQDITDEVLEYQAGTLVPVYPEPNDPRSHIPVEELKARVINENPQAVNPEGFDEKSVKLGYMVSFPVKFDIKAGKNIRKISVPKREEELQKLFANECAGKASFVTSPEIEAEIARILTPEDDKVAEEYFAANYCPKSFMRGYLSACAYIMPKKWVGMKEILISSADGKSFYIISNLFPIGKTSHCAETDTSWFSNYKDLKKIYEEVGFIQEKKMQDLKLLLRERKPRVLKVV